MSRIRSARKPIPGMENNLMPPRPLVRTSVKPRVKPIDHLLLQPRDFPSSFEHLSLTKPGIKSCLLTLIYPIDPSLLTDFVTQTAPALSVALLGPANAGKSSLVNALCNYNLKLNELDLPHRRSITSSVPYTTQHKLAFNLNSVRICDTPAVTIENTSQNSVDRNSAWNTVNESQVSMAVVDCYNVLGKDDNDDEDGNMVLDPLTDAMLKKLRYVKTRLILVINKCDLLNRDSTAKVERIGEACQQSMRFRKFEKVFAVSSKPRSPREKYVPTQFEDNIQHLYKYLQKDTSTETLEDITLNEQSQVQWVMDVVKEKIFRSGTRGGVPWYIGYKLNFNCTSWTTMPDASVRIDLNVQFPTKQSFGKCCNPKIDDHSEDMNISQDQIRAIWQGIRRQANVDVSAGLGVEVHLCMRVDYYSMITNKKR